MPMVRCPECGRVADGTACFACGHEWAASGAAATEPAIVGPPAASPFVLSSKAAETASAPNAPPAPPSFASSTAVAFDVGDLDAPDIDDLDVSFDEGPAPPAGPPPALSFLDGPPAPPAPSASNPFGSIPVATTAPPANPFSVPRPLTDTFSVPGGAGARGPDGDKGGPPPPPVPQPAAAAQPSPRAASATPPALPDDDDDGGLEDAFLTGARNSSPSLRTTPQSSSGNPFSPFPSTEPSTSAPAAPPVATTSRVNPFGSGSSDALANPFASADGVLGGLHDSTPKAPPPVPKTPPPVPKTPPPVAKTPPPVPKTPPPVPKMAAPVSQTIGIQTESDEPFDPFAGDSVPRRAVPPPPPLDLPVEEEGEDVPWDDFDQPPSEGWDQAIKEAQKGKEAASSGRAAAHADPDRTREMPLSMVPKVPPEGMTGLLADIDAPFEDDSREVDEPTVDTAHTPAYLAQRREPLSDRLIELAAELDAEGRHDAATLLHEAARALASQNL